MAKFYTQTGDDGYTGLLGEGRTPKYNPRIETIGTVDEANAALGFARSLCKTALASSIIISVQKDLYHIMTEIAALPENSSKFGNLPKERVSWLETQIAEITHNVSIPSDFIIPGDSTVGAVLDLTRTIVRRAERHIAMLLHQELIENVELLRYINRLSSLCFALELLENQAAGQARPTLAKE